jgi:signal transduction histidine kinase
MTVCHELVLKVSASIDYHGPTALPPVRISPTELTQVLINLIANSSQAVAARGGPDGNIDISARRDDTMLELEIRDNGIGMSPEVLARIGTPFFTTRATGTGLGIAQCQRLISIAGGRLRIDSVSGVGTTVMITLPIVA